MPNKRKQANSNRMTQSKTPLKSKVKSISPKSISPKSISPESKSPEKKTKAGEATKP
jgi:hypothetical protein